MQLVLVIFFVSCYCTKYVSGVTTQSSENVTVKEKDTIEEVNVIKNNYHELLKRVINNEIEISEQKGREQYLKNDLENTKRYMTCQMEDIKDFTEEKYNNLNETKAALMKTMISFSQSLTSLNDTIQERSNGLEIPEMLKCVENSTDNSFKSGLYIERGTSDEDYEPSFNITLRSTSDLESFQNLILAYTSKRHAYTPPVYRVRNRWRRGFNKKSSRWSVQEIKEKKRYPHLSDVIHSILTARLIDEVGMNRNVVLEADDPRRIKRNIAPIPPPPTQQIALEQKARSNKEYPDKTIDYMYSPLNN
ncbi:unnamed protein product [Mytilus edulis]|uniref:Uncharacterized protein n=1 Tax=Mytilus edulis TaxID=6550 RepID=A0A8S3SZ05_MYTED|nr:unnamed protein product [Mytilus edulis]